MRSATNVPAAGLAHQHPSPRMVPPSVHSQGRAPVIRLRDLSVADRVATTRLEDLLTLVAGAVAPFVQDPAEALDELRYVLAAEHLVEARQMARNLTRQGAAALRPLVVRQALHDVGGGAWPALLGHLSRVLSGDADASDVARVHVLAAEQLRLHRATVLDDAAADGGAWVDPAASLREAWSGACYHLSTGPVSVECFGDASGAHANRVRAYAALQRVVFNLVNNAAVYAEGGHLTLAFSSVDGGRDDDAGHLRIEVVNRVSPGRAAALRSRFGGDDANVLFRGDTAGDGGGLGLRTCVELVARAYGLPSLGRALVDGYLSARLDDDRFIVVAHWPATVPRAS